MSELNLPDKFSGIKDWLESDFVKRVIGYQERGKTDIGDAALNIYELATALSEAREATAVKINLARNLVVRIEELEKEIDTLKARKG